MIEMEKNKPMEPGEEVFNEIVESKNTGCGLKTPQYFNRVKMGYDWNNYNRVHFDAENPPPKIV